MLLYLVYSNTSHSFFGGDFINYNLKVYKYPNGNYTLMRFKKGYNIGYESAAEKENIYDVKEENIDNYEIDIGINGLKELIENGNKKHEHSIISSLSRTKKLISQYARSNNWEWFGTLTISSDKADRYNYKDCSSKVRKWIMNVKNRYSPGMGYICVPEQHKDGAWHFHLLMNNCNELGFERVYNPNKPDKLLKRKGVQIYRLSKYKLGFSDFTQVRDSNRSALYMLKYITKDLVENTKGQNRYYVSNNLDLPISENYYITSDEEFLEIVNKLCGDNKSIAYSKNWQIQTIGYENEICLYEITETSKTSFSISLKA